MSNVRQERQDRILVVTLDRAAARNAVDGPTATELHEAFVAFDADPELDVAVLTGAGPSFCAGADLRGMTEGRAVSVTEDGPGPLGPTRLVLGKPVIAAVEGYAVAGGLELALWCDLRVAARDSTFGVFCRRWGVPLIDGGTVRLPRLIGLSRALDLILTGRPVDAAEALQMGLANRVCKRGESRATAEALARTIAAFPQACMRNDRRSAYDQNDLPYEQAMARELALGLATIADGGGVVEGAQAFTQRRREA